MTVIAIWFLFFFSSRRRHTRLQGDWSSDVCSSDLATEAPLKETVRVAAVTVSVPLHVGVAESATLNPAGKTSLKPTPVKVVVVFGLVIVNVKLDVLPCGIDVGLNALAIEGALTTARLADAVLPVP